MSSMLYHYQDVANTPLECIPHDRYNTVRPSTGNEKSWLVRFREISKFRLSLACLGIVVVIVYVTVILIYYGGYGLFVVSISLICAFGSLLLCTFLMRQYDRQLKNRNRTPGRVRVPRFLLSQQSQNQLPVVNVPSAHIILDALVALNDDKSSDMWPSEPKLPSYNEVCAQDNTQDEAPPPSYGQALAINNNDIGRLNANC